MLLSGQSPGTKPSTRSRKVRTPAESVEAGFTPGANRPPRPTVAGCALHCHNVRACCVKKLDNARADARAISYATSFHFIAIGLAPFCAGLIGPVLGLRAYFVLTVVLNFLAALLWLRSSPRR